MSDRLNDVSIASRGTLELALARADAGRREAKGAQAGKHFEDLLGSMLVKEMRSTLQEGFFGATSGADTFNSWIDEHVGRMIAERGNFGLAEPIAREAERLNAGANVAATTSAVEPATIGAPTSAIPSASAGASASASAAADAAADASAGSTARSAAEETR